MSRLTKSLHNMKPGEKVYINAINLTIGEINDLRHLIKRGNIEVDPDELNRCIVADAQQDFINGDKIAPQMDYIWKGGRA